MDNWAELCGLQAIYVNDNDGWFAYDSYSSGVHLPRRLFISHIQSSTAHSKAKNILIKSRIEWNIEIIYKEMYFINVIAVVATFPFVNRSPTLLPHLPIVHGDGGAQQKIILLSINSRCPITNNQIYPLVENINSISGWIKYFLTSTGFCVKWRHTKNRRIWHHSPLTTNTFIDTVLGIHINNIFVSLLDILYFHTYYINGISKSDRSAINTHLHNNSDNTMGIIHCNILIELFQYFAHPHPPL